MFDSLLTNFFFALKEWKCVTSYRVDPKCHTDQHVLSALMNLLCEIRHHTFVLHIQEMNAGKWDYILTRIFGSNYWSVRHHVPNMWVWGMSVVSETSQIHCVVTDPGFPRQGGANAKGLGANLLICQKFSQKQHENERIEPRGAHLWRPRWISHCVVSLRTAFRMKSNQYLNVFIEERYDFGKSKMM